MPIDARRMKRFRRRVGRSRIENDGREERRGDESRQREEAETRDCIDREVPTDQGRETRTAEIP